MSRWLLALLFAFGTVTFVAGCGEDKPADDAAGDAADAAGDAADAAGDAAGDAADAAGDALDGAGE